MTPSEFEILFDEYYEPLCYFAHSIVEDKEVAKDIVSDLFTRIWEKDMKVNKAFLYIAVKNKCIDELRKHRPLIPIPDTEEIDRKIIKTDFMNKVFKEVKNMPEGQRKVCHLTYFEGLNIEEISKALNISATTVTSQRNRGLIFLKNRFK